jgi:hypothetical protein
VEEVLGGAAVSEERGRDMFGAAERLDLEGIVAKRKADAYRPETVLVKDLHLDGLKGLGHNLEALWQHAIAMHPPVDSDRRSEAIIELHTLQPLIARRMPDRHRRNEGPLPTNRYAPARPGPHV